MMKTPRSRQLLMELALVLKILTGNLVALEMAPESKLQNIDEIIFFLPSEFGYSSVSWLHLKRCQRIRKNPQKVPIAGRLQTRVCEVSTTWSSSNLGCQRYPGVRQQINNDILKYTRYHARKPCLWMEYKCSFIHDQFLHYACISIQMYS